MTFTSIATPVRVHAGDDALARLPQEVDRCQATRVYVLCSNSVATRSPLLDRIRALLGHRFAGAYTRLRKDAPLEDVQAAAADAKACGADLLVAAGAGSVLKAARVVAIALGEPGVLIDLATRYPAGGAPVSPRLNAPKPPIINVPTVASSAQCRAGSALRRADGGARLEFFDPKTRPVAILWDRAALLSAPPELSLSTGLAVYWRALMNRGAIDQANPLVCASRLHGFTLAASALPRMTDPEDAQARLDMCAAALLQNRDEDDGGRPFDAHWIARVVYALGAGLFNRVPTLDQGRTHAVLTSATMRHFADQAPDAVDQIGQALGLAPEQSRQPHAVIEAVEQVFHGPAPGLGLPRRLPDVTDADREAALAAALCNFNADRARTLQLHESRLRAILRETT